MMFRNWLNLFTLGHEATDVGALVVDPDNPNVVYVGGSDRYLMPNGQLEGARDHAFIRVDTTDMRDTNFISDEYPPSPLPIVPNDGDNITTAGDAAADSLINGGMLLEKGVYPGMGCRRTPAKASSGTTWKRRTPASRIPTRVTSRRCSSRASLTPWFLIPSAGCSLVPKAVSFAVSAKVGPMTRRMVVPAWIRKRPLMPSNQVSSIETALGVATPNEPGMIFTDLNANLQIADVTSVAIDPYNQHTLDASIQNLGWAQTTGSLQWNSTDEPVPGGLGGVDAFAVGGALRG